MYYSTVPARHACPSAACRGRTRNYEHGCLLQIRLFRGTPYPVVVVGARFPARDERFRYPSRYTAPTPLSSSRHTSSRCLSRRQAVKNDRGVSLVGQWQIEYILASSKKRVLRFVYRLSCYAKDRGKGIFAGCVFKSTFILRVRVTFTTTLHLLSDSASQPLSLTIERNYSSRKRKPYFCGKLRSCPYFARRR